MDNKENHVLQKKLERLPRFDFRRKGVLESIFTSRATNANDAGSIELPLMQSMEKKVGKNAMLVKSLDELLQKARDEVKLDDLKEIENKTGFGLEEILRKYIRYALNEKPFNPDVVAELIHLRRASRLSDSQVAEILNEITRRIVADKGPIVMNKSGYTEKGFKRKLALEALFGKVFYLSELPEFCSRDSSLVVKEIFGVTDDDADQLRLHTTSEAGNLDALEKMIDISDLEDSSEAS